MDRIARESEQVEIRQVAFRLLKCCLLLSDLLDSALVHDCGRAGRLMYAFRFARLQKLGTLLRL